MITEKTQGITLQSIPYKDRQRIISVFTKDQGIISLIIKGLSEKKPAYLSLTTPFCLAEIIYRKGRSDIYFLQDASIIDENLLLRKDLSYIKSAYLMAKAILDSQLPHKQATSLYQLLNTYLKKIPSMTSQDSLVISFLLKLLKHEGLIHLNKKCNLCDKIAAIIHRGESLCMHHAAIKSHIFSYDEFIVLEKLAQVQSFSEIDRINNIPNLQEKILNLFKDLI